MRSLTNKKLLMLSFLFICQSINLQAGWQDYYPKSLKEWTIPVLSCITAATLGYSCYRYIAEKSYTQNFAQVTCEKPILVKTYNTLAQADTVPLAIWYYGEKMTVSVQKKYAAAIMNFNSQNVQITVNGLKKDLNPCQKLPLEKS